jgi:hypothetical protein
MERVNAMDAQETEFDAANDGLLNVFDNDVSDDALEAAAGAEASWYPTSTAYLYYCQC